MASKMAGLMIGGLITISALGLTFGANSIGKAAPRTEQATVSSGTMQSGQMSSDMMSSPEMQKECQGAMASPEMQQTMREMMKQPQMQDMMKQMIASDPAFKQMMSDTVSNTEPAATDEQTPLAGKNPAAIDHNAHHINK